MNTGIPCHTNPWLRLPPGPSPAALRVMVTALQGGRCAACRLPCPRLQMDHDTGLLRGGLCRPCNISEGMARTWGQSRRDFAAYLANPPAACLAWLWAVPDGDPEVIRADAIAALAAMDLPPLEDPE